MNKNNQKSKVWDRPVSRKYYEDLRQRVKDIVSLVRRENSEVLMTQVMVYVDTYLTDPSVDFKADDHFSRESDIIFLTLRADLARAVERSRRAKARVAARRKTSTAESAPIIEPVEEVSDDHVPGPRVSPKKSIRIAGKTLKLRKVSSRPPRLHAHITTKRQGDL